MKIYGDLKAAAFETLSSAPSGNVTGRFWWNSTTETAQIDDGTNKYSLLRNDGKCVLGNSGTAANNVRLHRAANSTLQLVQGSDTTAEGSFASAWAFGSFKFETYTDAGKPAAGNAGRVIYISDLTAFYGDNGTTWVSLGTGTVNDGAVTFAKLNAQVVNGATAVTAVLADSVLIADASDSGNVKKALISTIKNTAVRSVTTTDTATTADETLVLSGASFTLTLFTAVGNEGKEIEIIHAGTSLTQVYTIDGNGSETINGATTVKQHTNGQVLRLRAVSGNWLIVASKTNTERIAWTPTITGFGTASNVSGFWERVGKDMIGQVTFTAGTVAASTASLSLPSGAVIDSAQLSISNTTAAAGPLVGRWTANTANPQRTDAVTATATSTTLIYAGGPQTSTPLVPATGSSSFASAAITAVEFRVPISEWLA